MGDSKNRKVPPKQKASSNSKRKNSSDQKENTPKREKTKTIKPDPEDGIAMSKQLLLKKSNARSQRQSSRTSSKPERICPNGKPLPSLSELEKMYEDSDDDSEQTPKTSVQKPKCSPTTPKKQSPPTSTIDKDLILPSTINKITERLLGSIQNQNLPSPDELLEAAALLRDESPPRAPVILPPKKRKPEVPYIVGCKDRPQVISKPSTNFCRGGDDYGVIPSVQEEEIPAKRAKKSRIPNYTKSIFNAQSDEIAERLVKDDAGNLSDASSDSNKTIEYDPTPFQIPRPLSFSPQPSTSTDINTFLKNDERFNESFKEVNTSKDSTPTKADHDKLIPETIEEDKTHSEQSTSLKKNDALIKKKSTPKIKDDILTKEKSTSAINEDDVQIVDISYDTIEIKDICDRTVEIQSTTSNTVDTDVIEIIEPVALTDVKPKRKNNTVDKILDDECMIITPNAPSSSRNNDKNLRSPTIIIEDEYSSINMEFDSFNDEPIEIIDVDDIIAENTSILYKWKKHREKEFNKINTVVDVPNTYRNVSTPQTTVTCTSTAVQTTSTPTTATTTLSAEVTPSTTLSIGVTPTTTLSTGVVCSTTLSTEVTPSTTLSTGVMPDTTLSTGVTPSTTVSAGVPPSTALSTGVTPSTTFLNALISTSDYNLNITTRQTNNQRQTEVNNVQGNETIGSMLTDFFNRLPNTSARATLDSGSRNPPEIIDVDSVIVENNTIQPYNITSRNVSTPQTTVTPRTAVQTTSTPTTANTTLSAGVTPSTAVTTSTITTNNNLNMTNRNSSTNALNNQMQTSSVNDMRSETFHGILDAFFESVERRPRNISSIYDSGNRITSLLTSMVDRLESRIRNGRRPRVPHMPRPTRNPTARAFSNQTSRLTSNRTAARNPIPRPTPNETPRPASTTISTPSQPLNTPVAATTSVSISSNSPSNSETQQTSTTIPPPSPIPTRNIGDCPICLDPLNTTNGMASTNCGHVFCLSCIQAAIKSNGKKCPTCRKALKGAGGGYHLLYL
ncbi:hypothetical protein PYW07_014767 [Mythimna separata]|uniref:RING-type domain-containing protein n=1 Tax=Mythimna separata TaxID=271217 RepID=A0AAD8E0G2_MYTSE|nr:hypothetical protein PYW07_014767 [Mythimna separata]